MRTQRESKYALKRGKLGDTWTDECMQCALQPCNNSSTRLQSPGGPLVWRGRVLCNIVS